MIVIEAKNMIFSVNNEQILPKCGSISFKLQQGESMLIYGESGSGKSTLFKLLSLEIAPTKGLLLFNNMDIHSSAKTHVLNKIGLIFQDNLLIDNLNSYTNIALPFIINNKQIDHKKICSLMEKFNIANCKKKDVVNLSGGEKKRVMICRATINDPLIIIADEPISGLDKEMARKVVEYLCELNKSGATIILTSHSCAELEVIPFSVLLNLSDI